MFAPCWLRKYAAWWVLPFIAASYSLTQAAAERLQPASTLVVTVSDENGVAVPSAQVFLQIAPDNTLRRCETDFSGRCQFSNVSATGVQLRVTKPGFYSVVMPNLQVGARTNLDVTLSHQQEVRETVNVVESPPAIDPAQVSDQHELTGVDI